MGQMTKAYALQRIAEIESGRLAHIDADEHGCLTKDGNAEMLALYRAEIALRDCEAARERK